MLLPFITSNFCFLNKLLLFINFIIIIEDPEDLH